MSTLCFWDGLMFLIAFVFEVFFWMYSKLQKWLETASVSTMFERWKVQKEFIFASESVATRVDNTSLRHVTGEKKEQFFPKFPLKAATRSICHWCVSYLPK